MTSKTTAEHRNHIINIFEKLREYGFKVKEAKCDFFLPEIKDLGHIINRDGRRPDSERANAIRNMPAPDNVYRIHIFSSLKISNKNILKNILEI